MNQITFPPFPAESFVNARRSVSSRQPQEDEKHDRRRAQTAAVCRREEPQTGKEKRDEHHDDDLKVGVILHGIQVHLV